MEIQQYIENRFILLKKIVIIFGFCVVCYAKTIVIYVILLLIGAVIFY